jgi:nucleoside-diphosphate-sugar epimerase
MRVLLTGPFGNIGRSTIDALISQQHDIRCFDIKNKTNEKEAKVYKGKIDVAWGDIRQLEDVAQAVEGQDAIIHLAAINNTKVSHTHIHSEENPELAEAVNVGGTRNLLDAAMSLPTKPPDGFRPRSCHGPLHASED